jgi:hypothetical protein
LGRPMEPKDFASALVTELESLPELRTASMREVRREYSKMLRSEEAQTIPSWIYVRPKIHYRRDACFLGWSEIESHAHGALKNTLPRHREFFHTIDPRKNLLYNPNAKTNIASHFASQVEGQPFRGLVDILVITKDR